MCAVVKEGSGLFPGRHLWRTSAKEKQSSVHFLKLAVPEMQGTSFPRKFRAYKYCAVLKMGPDILA